MAPIFKRKPLLNKISMPICKRVGENSNVYGQQNSKLIFKCESLDVSFIFVSILVKLHGY